MQNIAAAGLVNPMPLRYFPSQSLSAHAITSTHMMHTGAAATSPVVAMAQSGATKQFVARVPCQIPPSYGPTNLPATFRMLSAGPRRSGTAMHSIAVANSRKWFVIHFTNLGANGLTKSMISNPCYIGPLESPVHLDRIVHQSFPQLVVLDGSLLCASEEFMHSIIMLMERSKQSSNHANGISVIIETQFIERVPESLRTLCNIQSIFKKINEDNMRALTQGGVDHHNIEHAQKDIKRVSYGRVIVNQNNNNAVTAYNHLVPNLRARM